VLLRNTNLGRNRLRELNDLTQHTDFEMPSYNNSQDPQWSVIVQAQHMMGRQRKGCGSENGKMSDKECNCFDRKGCVSRIKARILIGCGGEGDDRRVVKD